MKASNITLTFNGNTEEAFNFYKAAFGGEFSNLQRMKDIPGDHPDMPADQLEKILYMQLPIGNSVIMGMDIPAHMPPTVFGTNFMITIDTESEAETTGLFNKLSDGGVIMMPLGNQFWGAFFGMFTDKFGIQWMLSYVAGA
jgi:PhnB protein